MLSLFSQVGIAFSSKRKSAGAKTLQNIMFAKQNLPDSKPKPALVAREDELDGE